MWNERDPQLTLVFPAHDEEPNVDPLLDAACEAAAKAVDTFEIVLVDDGSRDGTTARAAARARRDPRIRLLRHWARRGYGAALTTGLRAARGELVFFSDADLQFDLRDLSLLIAHRDDAEIVVGVRRPRRDPWPRRLLGRAGSALARALFGLRVRDVNCAFKLFRRDVLAGMPIRARGGFVNTEILARARASGCRIAEVPVRHYPRRHGRQSGASPAVLLGLARECWQLRGELRGRRSHSR